MLDIKTLGAGGGSIAWVDEGGGLQVGPQSAGADPGPACYARGGALPTVTDANLLLGFLNAGYFADGELMLSVDQARAAIERHVAQPMGLQAQEAAEGILRVAEAVMMRGIRLVSVERGYDARQFCLFCFGGAGPTHAVRLAHALEISKIVVPASPGVNCALGLLMADFRHDYSRTLLGRLAGLKPELLSSVFRNLEAAAGAQMDAEGVSEEIVFRRSADVRYAGQGYELNLPLRGGDYAHADLQSMCLAFGDAHTSLYGYALSSSAVELVNVRLAAFGMLAKPRLARQSVSEEDPSSARKGTRQVYLEGEYHAVPIYDRGRLKCGNMILPPAIVEQPDTTTLVLMGYLARVDHYRNLVLTKELG